ncbi:MAG TPA: ribonuclease HI [Bacteroidales bacterium]|nr:ribonuclease HI [Bacteroidales bacterium]HPS46007.1 ribonuclease HI [Bacteroidales bacterium]HQH18684.1 ribonuclease HI [Bacteroidales bacterium]HQI45862.1 ribonuclease HI [Bacteroidales bacterium]
MPLPITIYTDGSARGNPGPGGYGVVMISGKHRKELSQGFRHTTNNRMELLSVIVALETLKIMNSEVTIYSDSKYVVEAVEKGWLFDWEKTNFKKKKNIDLWKRFLKIYTKHNIKFIWIKGHANNPLNEVCDKMAVAASFSSNLMIDEEYEKIMEQDK